MMSKKPQSPPDALPENAAPQQAPRKKNSGAETLLKLGQQLESRHESSRQAGHWELAETAQLMINLVQVAECSLDDPQSAEQAAEIIEFIEGQLPLFESRDDAALEMLAQSRQLASEFWGDALELLGQPAAVPHDAIPDFVESGTVERGDAGTENASQQIDLVLSLLNGSGEGPAASIATPESLPRQQQQEAATKPAQSAGAGAMPEPPTRWSVPDELKSCQELCDAFLDDAHRCLGEMESIAMDASSPGNDRERSRAFCRELHTIKGAAASVGLEALAGFMHEVEEWLEHTVISGKQSLNGDLLLAAVDSVRQQIAVLEGSGESAAAPEGLSDKPARNLAPIAATPSTRASGGSAGDQSVRVRAQQLDRLMDMLAELVAMRNRREVSSGDMKRLGEELGRCANRLRKFGEESLSLSHGIHDHKSVSGEREYLLLSSEPTGKNSLDEVATDIATITRELNEKFRPLADENAALTGFIRHFRQELMQLRRLPVSGLFQRLKRAIHDAARLENKQVDIRLEGEDTGLEQAMQERLFEPLLHMVRNSVSHGIETPEIRKSSRKPAGGTVTLSAHASASMLTIVVADDGRGLDYDALRRRGFERGLLTPGTNPGERQLAKLIFHPGFSTRETASQVSGRGVGMDVVATTIDRLQGRIEVDSKPNAGMSIRISIPLTTGIEHVMVYRAGGQLFALPMRSIEAANKMASSEVTMVNFSLALAIHGNPGMPGGTESLLLDPELGIQVDEVVGPEEAVVRPLPEILRRHPLVSGVVLSAQGEIVLLLNAERTREWCLKNAEQSSVAPEPESDDKGPEHVAGESERQKRRALVVDDSLSARMAMKRKLAQRDFEVAEAGDGLAALACMRATHFDLVVTDLDMPRMGGLELLGEIARGNFLETTIVVSSSRAKSDVWQRVHEQGAHGYLSKPVSSEALDEVLRATGSMA